MGQATENAEDEGGDSMNGPYINQLSYGAKASTHSRAPKILPSLGVAVVCTALIAEAIVTAVHGRANGDLMVIVCPILGATFLSIPAVQAWWMVIRNLKKAS